MSIKQKIVLWIGIVIIVLMCLLPPWVRVIEIEGSRLVSRPFYVYAFPNDLEDIYELFLLLPPEPLRAVYRLDHYDLSDKNFPFDYGPGWVRDKGQWVAGQGFGLDYVQVDILRLSIQCAIVALITGGLLCTFTTKEKYKQKDKKVEI